MDNRHRMLDAALHLFATRGYDAVGVQEIVEAVGLTKPSLYHHFGSKLGLLESLIAWRGDMLLHIVERAAAYEGDLPLTLNRVVQAYFAAARREPDFQRFRLALWLAPGESEAGRAIAEHFRREAALMVALFEAAAADHGNMRGRAALLAPSFLGMIHAHVSQHLRHQGRLDDELAFRALHQFMHGIYS